MKMWAAVVAGLVFVGLAPAVEMEATFRDKPAGYWIKALSDARRQEEAARKLFEGGREALPVLLVCATGPDYMARVVALGVCGQLGRALLPDLEANLRDGNARTRLGAVRALGAIGPASRAAVRPLLRALHDTDGDVRQTALAALGEIGPGATEAVPTLIRMLRAGTASVPRPLVLAVLGAVGPAAREATPVLLADLDADDAEVRTQAYSALIQISLGAARPAEREEPTANSQRPGKYQPPPLIEFRGDADHLGQVLRSAQDTDGWIRQFTRTRLSKTHHEKASRVAALTAALKDKDPRVRQLAVVLLSVTGLDSRGPRAAVVGALQDDDAGVRRAAALALRNLGQPAVALLVARLGKRGTRVAADALVDLGRPAVAALIHRLDDADPQARGWAAHALDAIGPVTDEVVPALIRAFRRQLAASPTSPLDQSRLVRGKSELGQPSLSAPTKADPRPSEAEPPRAPDDYLYNADDQVVRALGRLAADKRVMPVLIDALGHDGRRASVLDVLAQLGSGAAEAVPALVALLEQGAQHDDPSHDLRATSSALAKIGKAAVPALAHALAHADVRVRRQAAAALVAIGDPAAAVLSRTLTAGPEATRLAVIVALAELQSDQAQLKKLVAPALAAAVKDHSPAIRARAAKALGDFGRDAIQPLIAALKDPRREVRREAAESLGQLRARSAVPALIEALEDQSEGVNAAAADALSRMGRHAQPATGALLRLVRDDPDVNVRLSAMAALAAIRPPADAAVPVLAAALKDDDTRIWSQAAKTLGAIGPEARAAVPALLEALKRRAGRLDIACALAQLGNDSEAVVSVLRDQVSQADITREYDWQRAVDALAQLGPAGRPVAARLLAVLTWTPQSGVPEPMAFSRQYAAEALARIGPATSKDMKDLIKALNPPGEVFSEVAEAAAQALPGFGPDAKAAVPGLVEALRSSNYEVRAKVAQALGNIGPAAKPAVPALLRLLRSKQPFTVQFGAAYALVQIGEAKQGGPELIRVLNHGRKNDNGYAFTGQEETVVQVVDQPDDPLVRMYAHACLWQIGEAKAADVLPHLIAGLDADAFYGRAFAARILGDMGPQARKAVPALLKALNDRDYAVRRQAAQSLKRIDPAAAARAGVP